jgi:hypothetical protein
MRTGRKWWHPVIIHLHTTHMRFDFIRNLQYAIDSFNVKKIMNPIQRFHPCSSEGEKPSKKRPAS